MKRSPQRKLSHADRDTASVEDGGFLVMLDETLRRKNARMSQHLLAWSELLNNAGWCVALRLTEESVWLSSEAERALGAESGDRKWSDLVAWLHQLPAGSVQIAEDAVLVWGHSQEASPSSEAQTPLTKREQEVLHWVREGKSGAEIAIILGCAARTVEKHMANLYRKLGTRDRATTILRSNERKAEA